MVKRETYYVSRKNPLTWISVLILLASVAIRIAFFCEKGADTQTLWMQLVLPIAACAIYALILLLDGREHFYRTLIPVSMMAIYFVATLLARDLPRRYVFLNALLYLAFLIFYKQITGGHGNRPWLLPLMYALGFAVLLYDSRNALLNKEWKLLFWMMQDAGMLFAGLLTCFAMQPHLDGKYHPTWGDRPDGRRVRTGSPFTLIIPYIMERRNEADNFIRDEIEITNMEKYVREKRKQGLTSFGVTHVFLATYVRAVARYPQLNRFLAGQRIYSRGDDIQFSMVVKKEMTVESPDTAIKLHLKPSDTPEDIYNKMEAAVKEVKNIDESAGVEQLAHLLTLIPGLLLRLTVRLLRLMDYFGLLPKKLLELSPFHASVFFTSMGSLGIPAIVHHLYDFGNMPVFIAFGCKYRRNEIANDGTILHKKYIDITGNLDERICDGFYYATAFKYMKRFFADPYRLDTPPETIEKDVP